MSRRGARVAGFTLIELMAAVFLTTVVLSLAWAVYLNLSSGLETARERATTDPSASSTSTDRVPPAASTLQ